MPPIPKPSTCYCDKCGVRAVWEHSKEGLCWWCHGKPSSNHLAHVLGAKLKVPKSVFDANERNYQPQPEKEQKQ